MISTPLPALDGSNPLAFLAALGVLEVVSATDATAALAWRSDGSWQPTLSSRLSRQEIVGAIMADIATWKTEPIIELEYDGKRDLKPPPAEWTKYLASLTSRRSQDFASAFATDVAVDNNGNVKPLPLHFSAGQQLFLKMARELRDGIEPSDIEEALFGPWRYARELPVLQWDASTARDYALRASDPSKDKKLGVPGADWLAFVGLRFIQSAPERSRIQTTGCRGGWKTGFFRWPLWIDALRADAVRVALRLPMLRERDRGPREVEPWRRRLAARGIAVVFESAIRRSDQGGYGSFAPAVPVI